MSCFYTYRFLHLIPRGHSAFCLCPQIPQPKLSWFSLEPFFISHTFSSAPPAIPDPELMEQVCPHPLRTWSLESWLASLHSSTACCSCIFAGSKSVSLHNTVTSSAGPVTNQPLLGCVGLGAGECDGCSVGIKLGRKETALCKVSACSKLSSSGLCPTEVSQPSGQAFCWRPEK